MGKYQLRYVPAAGAGEEEVRQVQVFAGGVSGDTAEVIHPKTGEKDKLHRVMQFSWTLNGEVNQLLLKPLPRKPVAQGTSVRDLSNSESSWTMYAGNSVVSKWIFR